MTNPPAIKAADMAEEVARWINKADRVRCMLSTNAGRPYRMEIIRQWVLEGGTKTMLAVEAAEAGCEEADLVLRQIAIDMLDRGEMPDAAMRVYAQKALLRPIASPPRGRDASANWLRDIGAAVLVALAVERWHPDLPATRNPASKGPSAALVVSLALGRHGINIGEARVAKIWGGLAGHLAAHQAWLSASNPST